MAYIKFLTVFDDEGRHILREKKQKCLDIAAYPSVFSINDRPYYEMITADAKAYVEAVESGENVTAPYIPADVFEQELVRAYNEGFFGAVIVCPHSYWTDYKHQAEIAVKRFKRKVEIDELGFRIKIFDCKQIGAGVAFMTIFFAETFQTYYHSTSDFFAYMDYFKDNPIMYILAQGQTAFGGEDGLNAFIVRKNRCRRLDLSCFPDSVIYDKFAEAVCKDLYKYSRDMVVSLGSDCSFGGNVLGRIERDSAKIPLCTVQYGIPTASVVGNKAVCISIV